MDSFLFFTGCFETMIINFEAPKSFQNVLNDCFDSMMKGSAELIRKHCLYRCLNNCLSKPCIVLEKLANQLHNHVW